MAEHLPDALWAAVLASAGVEAADVVRMQATSRAMYALVARCAPDAPFIRACRRHKRDEEGSWRTWMAREMQGETDGAPTVAVACEDGKQVHAATVATMQRAAETDVAAQAGRGAVASNTNLTPAGLVRLQIARNAAANAAAACRAVEPAPAPVADVPLVEFGKPHATPRALGVDALVRAEPSCTPLAVADAAFNRLFDRNGDATPAALVVPVDGAASTERLALALFVRAAAWYTRVAGELAPSANFVTRVQAHDVGRDDQQPRSLLGALPPPQPEESLRLASVGVSGSRGDARVVDNAMQLAAWLERLPSLTSARGRDGAVRVLRVAVEWPLGNPPAGDSARANVASTGVTLLLADTVHVAHRVLSGNGSDAALPTLLPHERTALRSSSLLLPLRMRDGIAHVPHGAADAIADLSQRLARARGPTHRGPVLCQRSVYQPVPMVAHALRVGMPAAIVRA